MTYPDGESSRYRDVVGVLQRARQLIRDPEHWLQRDALESDGPSAVDDHGKAVLPADPSARAWTVMGAITRESEIRPPTGDPHASAVNFYIEGLKGIGGPDLGGMPKLAAHQSAIAALGKAIDLCRDRAARFGYRVDEG